MNINMNILYYCHRINTSSELQTISNNYGVEIDLRDSNKHIIVTHDPFTSGELFEEYLKYYNKKSIILNIKSERIEYTIIDILKKNNITDYFFLDCSFPMIYQLHKQGENNIAIRLSEFESIETVLLVAHMVKWVWVDCFTSFPLTKEIYNTIKKANLKIILVSPELQSHTIDKIHEYKDIIKKNNFKIDAICTKYYNIPLWEK